MNYLILKKDKESFSTSCLECFQKGIYKEYLKNFSDIIGDIDITDIVCPTDIVNKYLSISNRKNIFFKLDDNSISSTFRLGGCVCRYILDTLIYKLII